MSSSTGFKISKGLIATVGIIVVAVIVLVSLFGTVNSTRNEGINRENALEAQYRSNQNELSTYILTIKESLGIADKGNNKIDEILSGAIQGRYDGNMEPGTGGSMFSAITEAYPDLTSNMEMYSKVQDAVVSGRAAFKNQQNKLLDMISNYENWLQEGLIRSTVVKFIGFPSGTLEARVGDTVYTGQEALTKMKQIVLVKDATVSYETGETAPLIEPEK